MRYVLSTFVVMPIRWNADYGWRPLTELEKRASVAYHRELGRRMGIRDLPGTWQEWERLLDAYEAEHFAPDPGGRRVADATLELLHDVPAATGCCPGARAGRGAGAHGRPAAAALGYERPPALLRAAVRGRAAGPGRVVRWLPRRREPRWFRVAAGRPRLPGRLRASAGSARSRAAAPSRTSADPRRRPAARTARRRDLRRLPRGRARALPGRVLVRLPAPHARAGRAGHGAARRVTDPARRRGVGPARAGVGGPRTAVPRHPSPRPSGGPRAAARPVRRPRRTRPLRHRPRRCRERGRAGRRPLRPGLEGRPAAPRAGRRPGAGPRGHRRRPRAPTTRARPAWSSRACPRRRVVLAEPVHTRPATDVVAGRAAARPAGRWSPT